MAKQPRFRRSRRSPSTASELTKPSPAIRGQYPFLDDFFAFGWGVLPLREAYGTYALSLYGNYADYLEMAADASTEGGDDKDIDFCFVDRENGKIFAGQSYLAEVWNKPDAPSNKADDLLTGLTWLLKRELNQVPKQIREKAREVQEALDSGDVTHLYLLFIHNCQQSKSVAASLRTVANNAKILVQNPGVSVVAEELGLPEIQRRYQSLTKLIVVEDRVSFPIEAHYREDGEGWLAISTTIGGDELHRLWQRHRNDLFSANVRGFLEMLNRNASINRGILETIQQEPTRFWAYNNGITILTKRITIKEKKVTALGVSVINGAQTTGVIGEAPEESAKKVRVPCRFIQCNDQALIDSIIQKNNTQNEIKSFDLRSNDPTQRRLGDEFKKYAITYVHRREGASRLPTGAIQAESLAPHLAAFHDRFQVAARQRRAIFQDMSIYGAVFPSGIRAEHLYLVQTMADAISMIKLGVKERADDGLANPTEMSIHNILQYSTAKYFVAGVVAELIQMILNRPVPSRSAWVVDPKFVKPERARVVTAWKLTLEALVPLIAEKVGNGTAAYDTVRSAEKLREVATNVGFSIQALRHQLDAVFAPLRDVTDLRP